MKTSIKTSIKTRNTILLFFGIKKLIFGNNLKKEEYDFTRRMDRK